MKFPERSSYIINLNLVKYYKFKVVSFSMQKYLNLKYYYRLLET
jgi:hypothetical protein